MSLRQKQSEFVRKVSSLILFAYELGYELTFGDTYPGKFKHKPNSYHGKGLAIDLNLFKNGKYLTSWEAHKPLGEYWELMGGSWGGRWDMNIRQPGHQGDGNHYSWGERKAFKKDTPETRPDVKQGF